MTINPEVENKLRQGFKYLNRFMLLMWRLGMGKWLNMWPAGLGRYLVITHIGRKSGQRRRTPVNYATVDEEIDVTVGFGSTSDSGSIQHPCQSPGRDLAAQRLVDGRGRRSHRSGKALAHFAAGHYRQRLCRTHGRA